MPHDINSQALKAGDHVMVECVVDYVCGGEEWCNVGLKTVLPMLPGNQPTSISLNAGQVRKVE